MLREDLQNELKNAMKNKDMASDADLLAMMQTMIKQRNESIKIYLEGKRQDLADKEQSEIDVINRFLPKQMTKDEIEKVIKDIIAQTGASGIKDMGKIMGVLKTNYAGQMDFGMASGIIKGLLA